MKRLIEVLKIKPSQGLKQFLKIPSLEEKKKVVPCGCGIICYVERLKGDFNVFIILCKWEKRKEKPKLCVFLII